MSKPRHYWYGISKKMCYRYYSINRERGSIQELLFLAAINRALAELSNEYNGKEQRKAVEDILFKQRYTTAGVAYRLHYSETVVQRWISDFVNKVGRYAGYN